MSNSHDNKPGVLERISSCISTWRDRRQLTADLKSTLNTHPEIGQEFIGFNIIESGIPTTRKAAIINIHSPNYELADLDAAREIIKRYPSSSQKIGM